MRHVTVDGTFDGWRHVARALLVDGVPPDDIVWRESSHAEDLTPLSTTTPPADGPRVPAAFVERARMVACHRNPRRLALMYRVLWRLTHGERDLLRHGQDADVQDLMALYRAVHWDVKELHAELRFRQVEGGLLVASVAPEHRILPVVAPEIARQHPGGCWSMVTPDGSAHCDGRAITYSRAEPSIPDEPPPNHDDVLPDDLPDALPPAEADGPSPDAGATRFLPMDRSIPSLRQAAQDCVGCSLATCATQAVFGRGPSDAIAVFIGEQPGDEEDITGAPFVGPAGRVLEDALAAVGIARERVYVTNVVKHFKWEPRGRRRLHVRPTAAEVFACRPWLEAELRTIRPQIIVCLGITAARAVLGGRFRLQDERGQPRASRFAPWTMCTFHPAALMRLPDGEKASAEQLFMMDLRLVAERMDLDVPRAPISAGVPSTTRQASTTDPR